MLNSVRSFRKERGGDRGREDCRQADVRGGLVAPGRCRALTILADREASPVEIARELGFEPSHVAYHVRLLLQEGLIELTKELPRRGSIEHRFRAVFFELTDDDYAELTAEERSMFSRVIFSFAAADASVAFSSGSFGGRHDHHISRFPLQVDDRGWGEVHDLYVDLLEQLYRIKRESGERLTKNGASSPGTRLQHLLRTPCRPHALEKRGMAAPPRHKIIRSWPRLETPAASRRRRSRCGASTARRSSSAIRAPAIGCSPRLRPHGEARGRAGQRAAVGTSSPPSPTWARDPADPRRGRSGRRPPGLVGDAGGRVPRRGRRRTADEFTSTAVLRDRRWPDGGGLGRDRHRRDRSAAAVG